MALKKQVQVTYDKVIGGQKVTFVYSYDNAAPQNISVNTPLIVPGTEPNQSTSNGFLNISVNTAMRETVRQEMKNAIDAAFTEFDNILANYENPEGV